ncbi:AraC family transcriptional regulator [Caballeronia glebae]|uniref:AraC family transcriptional regulator n=1 Tax=Caballeronia glebae TaxID=1777143 RepID=A0A158AUI4_9BURK|nr:AraC family transcriptional regulator [Caballeronia glebae]SAK61320.1 AraC family transcriptional regulator [Caballeronia glebae]
MEQLHRPPQLQRLSCHGIGASCADCALNSAQWILCIIPADRTTAHAITVRSSARPYQHLSVSAPFIAVVPAWARVKLVNDDDPCGLVVALHWARLRETARNALGTTACEIPCWFKAWDPFLRDAGDTLSALHANSSPDPRCLAAFADVFALHLAHRYGLTAGTPDAATSLTHSKLSVVEHFIHEHIADNIQIADLAAVVHMSQSHFARAFKTATGHPPHFFLTTERLRLAQSMLSEGSLSLIDIAARVGFQTQQHFTAVFHRYAGCTPRAFRIAHYRP